MIYAFQQMNAYNPSKADTWMGVPDKITRRFTSRELRAWNVRDSRYGEGRH
jgi:hypothetical protein